MLAIASAEIDRGRGLPALPAPQLCKHIGERPIAVVTDEQSHRIDRLSAATVHLQPTVRPVGKALAEAEGWRMHRDRLFMKHIGNKPRDMLVIDRVSRHLPEMYVVSEADAAAIREAYETGGELSAAIELRRRFPGITDNAKAREQAKAIAGWQPLPSPQPRAPRRSRKGKADAPAR